MEKTNGKTLKEWKLYCKDDIVPIKTIKYITCLEERIKQLAIPVSSLKLEGKQKMSFRSWRQSKGLRYGIGEYIDDDNNIYSIYDIDKMYEDYYNL